MPHRDNNGVCAFDDRINPITYQGTCRAKPRYNRSNLMIGEMMKIKSSYNYGRTGKHGIKRRSKSNTSGAFGTPRKKRKVCKRCGIRLSYEEERSGFDLCEPCRDQNLKDGYPQNFLHRD